MSFLNLNLEVENEVLTIKEKIVREEIEHDPESCRLNDLLEAHLLTTMHTNAKSEERDRDLEILHNEIAQSQELETLFLTLKSQYWGGEVMLQKSILDWIREGRLTWWIRPR